MTQDALATSPAPPNPLDAALPARKLPSDEPRLQPVQPDEVDAVMAIELRAYPFPWSRGNFTDSHKAGHRFMGLWGRDALRGYCVSMGGVEERHLLNLTIDPDHQGRGLAQHLLNDLVAHARAAGELRLWLEVRQSNTRAQALYRRRGFAVVGLRRGYYPNGHGQREDAVVMAADLAALPQDLAGSSRGVGA